MAQTTGVAGSAPQTNSTPQGGADSNSAPPTINKAELISRFGYKYDLLFNFTFSPLNPKNADGTATAVRSNAFGTDSFNALYGFGVDSSFRKRYGVVFNISNKTEVVNQEDTSNKILLPNQRGFVINGFLSDRRTNFDLLKFSENDHTETIYGRYLNYGVSPFSWKSANNDTDEGWLGFFSYGYQIESPRFKVGDSSIGTNSRLGITVRNLSGFSKDAFWQDFLGDAKKRKRTFIGAELGVRFDMGTFRPTLLITHFPKDKISKLSGTNFNLIFDLNQVFNLEKSKSISGSDVLSCVLEKRINNNKGKFLVDEEAALWKEAIKLLSGASNSLDIRIFETMIEELKKRETQITTTKYIKKQYYADNSFKSEVIILKDKINKLPKTTESENTITTIIADFVKSSNSWNKDNIPGKDPAYNVWDYYRLLKNGTGSFQLTTSSPFQGELARKF